MLVLCALSAAALNAAAGISPKPPAAETEPWFEPNRGQAEEHIRFIGRGRGYAVLLDAGGSAVFIVPGVAGDTASLRLSLAGAAAAPAAQGRQPTPSYTNYYTGSEPSRWLTDVPHYRSVRYRDVYPGIDMEWRPRGGMPEYVFRLAPGADPSSILLRFDTGAEPSVDTRGDLVVTSRGHRFRFRKPTAYQRREGVRQRVAAEYRCAGNTVHFEVGPYDRTTPLVIDPLLTLSTLFGGSSRETATAVAVDESGAVYVAGETYSPDFSAGGVRAPWTSGYRRAFVLKLAPNTSTVLYMAIFSGSGNDAATAVAAVPGGGVVVAGTTGGAGFPVTAGALRTTYGGQTDAFVARLDAQGRLLFSTYLGDAGEDRAMGVAADRTGNVYVGGYTSSLRFPVASGGAGVTYRGGFFDGFVAKLNATGTALLYSALIGGTGNDQVRSLAVTPAGGACIAGYTDSPDLPVTNAFQPAYAGGGDAMTGCLDPSGSRWTFLSYLGGRLPDEANAVTVDSAGSLYVVGDTASDAFPVSARALQSVLHGPYDAFAVKLNAYGVMQYSTLLGGSGSDAATAVAVDGAGQAWLTGRTDSSDFPQQGGVGTGYRGNTDMFIAQLGVDGSVLLCSGLLGGGGDDIPTGLATVSGTDVVLSGTTTSQDFPVAGGVAVQGVDALMVRLSASLTPFAFLLAPASGAGSSVTYTAVFANAGGAEELEWANLLINSSLDAAGACYVGYYRPLDLFYLGNDTGSGPLGPLKPGANATLENSQCTLKLSTSAATASGSTLTLKISLSFKPRFGGSRTAYLFASNRQGLNSGWGLRGTWTVPGGNVVAANSATPSSGSGASVNLSAVFSSSTGYADFAWTNVLINSSLNPGAACYVGYYAPGNVFYLSDDAANGSIGPLAPGTSGVLRNSQCAVDVSTSSVSGAGNTLTLTLVVSFTPAFAGQKNVYLFASSVQGSNTGWQKRGSWTVTAPVTVTADSLSPSSGTGPSASFVVTITDTAGYADLAWVNLLVNSALDGGTGCYVGYYRPLNALYLDSGTGSGALGPLPAGQPGTLQNSRCTLNAGASGATGTGNTLAMTFALTFKTVFAGSKDVYVLASSVQGPASAWQARGTWTVPGTPTVTADSVSPSSGSGSALNAVATFTDTQGYADFEWATVLINSSLNTAGACYVGYYAPAGLFYLGNDASTGALGPLTPGSAGTIQNSQCTLDVGASSVLRSGNTLTLSLAVTFKTAFTGAKTVYISSSGMSGAGSGWQQRGSWTVP